MQVALLNKINGNFVISEIMQFSGQDLELFENYAMIDDATKYMYNALVNEYGKVYIKEEDIFKKSITKDSFIYLKEDLPEGTTLEAEELELKKVELYNYMDNNLALNIQKISFLTYIHYITLFNYFAAKGIFITEDNKEDKYIEILELDDESAIEKLELYLSIQDELKPFLELNNELIQTKEDIDYADEEELEVLAEKIIPTKIL